MKVTIIGSGDAFGTAGRAHTCIRLNSAAATLLVDFGAGSITAWQKLGFSSDDVDAIVITHLHGDHFGGLPLLLMHCQFVAHRRKPLSLYGPAGLEARLRALFDVFFPGIANLAWSFAWPVVEIAPGYSTEVAGFKVETFPVEHMSDGLATGVRISDGTHVFAYSGDTAWTETLLPLSADADLFLIECFSGEEAIPNHMNWSQLLRKLPFFTAKRLVVTHLGVTALPKIAEMRAAGLTVAEDGSAFDL